MDRRTFVRAAAGAAVATGVAAAGTAAAATAGPGKKFDPYAAFLALIRAWKKHDIEAVLGMLADDIVWYTAVGAAPTTGKDAVRKVLEGFAPKRKAENWKIFHHATSGNRLFVEGVDDFTDDQDRRIAVPYAGVIEFRDGRITGWRDYFDIGTLGKMKAGEPIPAVIQPLFSRPGEP
jgi:uncharacterized protein (TIGR02246 family)